MARQSDAMTSLLFDPALPALPVLGSTGLYPVRRIFCVGRNYAAHAREMGGNPDREPPFFFMKSATDLVPEGGAIPYPPATAGLHHEVELVVALGAPLFRADPARAATALFGLAVGIDFTRRDLQTDARQTGRPWALGKSFDGAAPVSALLPATLPPRRGALRLAVNGEVRQRGDLADMIWPVAELLAHLSGYGALGPGDIVFTGTPDGVGPVMAGDGIVAEIDGIGGLSVLISAALPP
jgi:fumarylpyruvate hydrolase